MLSFLLLSTLMAGTEVKSDVVYRTVADTPVLMDIYLPDKPVRTPVPVVMVIHGGAWISGSKKDMTPLALELANRGVAVANINYRLAPKSKWPAQIEDCQEAVLFVKQKAAEFGFDPERIGAVGGSAGAHLSLLLGSTDLGQFGSSPASASDRSARVMAVVNLFGPVDLTQDFERNVANMVSMQVIGKKYEEATKEAVAFSPVTYIKQGVAPVFTLHGTTDPLVPVKQAERLDEAMKKAGVEHRMVVVEGMGHGVTSKDAAIDAKIKSGLAESLDWLVVRLTKE